MRTLRVVGLEEDGETVVCEDPDNGERFAVPADERLRAAARGDLTRLGQVQIEMESQMRPREIQARVRAGASVEEIAAAAGIPEQRVERYAHPVLLERAQVAERAQRAHPVREDGPDVQTLGEVVAHTFGMRGQDHNETSWDSWRGEDGTWIVSLRWQAGCTENTAHWSYHPGAQGGTISPLDEDALDLLDPSPSRPLRTVRPVTELAREALELDHEGADEGERHATLRETPAPVLGQSPAGGARGGDGAEEANVKTPHVPPVSTGSLVNSVTGSAENGQPRETDRHGTSTAEQPAQDETDPETELSDEETDPPQGRKNHPIVPSWEDVLLGVRSNR
ncbi:septation protein SepH [Actinopolyspora mortivallis]|uniref:DUF3071 domain-containing protein n=1 Tax=Actinopolyspora mortivallis TaxID=33906 RepID=A0A2T0GV34_ACTMO|nr:septation protein SepH [Actinopolyspora mortivallis]PRW62975.1 DUF3071 domain-containing protein [Actinopolyspora mortivallis]